MTNRVAETVIDRLQERCTNMQRPEEFMRNPGIFDLKDRETGEIKPHKIDRNTEYELSLTIGCRYWANKVQRSSQRRNAESVIARLLYQDVLASLSEIRHAIYDGDQTAALGRIADLEARLER